MKFAYHNKAEQLRKLPFHGLWGMTRPPEEQ